MEQKAYQGIIISGFHENKWIVSDSQEYRQPLCTVHIQDPSDLNNISTLIDDAEEVYYWSPIFKLVFLDYPDHNRPIFGVWHTDQVSLDSDSEPVPIREKITEILDFINDILAPQISNLLRNTNPFSAWLESEQLSFIKGIWELVYGVGLPMYPDSQTPIRTGSLTVKLME